MNEIIILYKKGYTRDQFIDMCIEFETTTALAEHLGCTRATVSRCLTKYFPDMKKGKIGQTFGALKGIKTCSKCKHKFPLEDFGKDTWCNPCSRKYRNAAEMKRIAAKLQRTPAWADHDKIKEIYYNCPEGYEVDHIIPLQGDLVSGLHVENNLQYLTKFENCSKGNRYTP